MGKSDFTYTILTDTTSSKAFDAILDVPAWWSEDFTGNSKKQNDEFSVQFDDVHYSKQKLTEVIPNRKVVWLVTDSRLNFLKNKSEWTGTKIIFEVTPQTNKSTNNKTQIIFTHLGLTPNIECFNACSGGWNYYLKSLSDLIFTGMGNPHRKRGVRHI